MRPITRHSASVVASGLRFAARGRGEQLGRRLAETARDRIAGGQPLDVADIAAAAQRLVVVVDDEAVAGMAGIAVLAAQHAAVDAQPDADAGAPGDVGAMVDALQRAPAPLGLERGDRIVLDPHVGEAPAQRRLDQRGHPLVRQPARRAGDAAADVRRRQLDHAVAQISKGPADETPTRSIAALVDALLGAGLVDQPHDLHAPPHRCRRSWRSARCGGRSAASALSAERLTATLVPPMSTQALILDSDPSCDQAPRSC